MRIFKEICNALREGKQIVVATIVATQGSTPAPSESRMCVLPGDGGRAIGTIGGGCLDAEILTYAREARSGAHARLREIDLNDDTGDTGLVCGGKVTVLVESLMPSMLPLYEKIVAEGEKGNEVLLSTTISHSGSVTKTVTTHDEMKASGPDENEMTTIRELIRPDPPLFVFGGGHLGLSVSKCAAIAGFRVIVIDDRKAFANKERFPEAERVLCESFDEAFKRIALPASAYVVIVTRGHRHDELVLENVLLTAPAYVGMIGSRRKVRFIFDRLEEKGVSKEILSRVHAPIGLSIGARTPGEIGISIVAELIRERRGAHDVHGKNAISSNVSSLRSVRP